MTRKIYPLVVLVAVCLFSYFAYSTVNHNQLTDAKAELEKTKQQLQAESQAKTDAQNKASARETNLQNALVIAMPDRKQQIDMVFTGKPATQPATQAATQPTN
jgi:hypothetical protein